MGYPEEDSEEKKLEIGNKIGDELSTESSKIGHLADNETIHTKDFDINNKEIDSKSEIILPVTVALNYLNANPLIDSIKSADKLCTQLGVEPVDNLSSLVDGNLNCSENVECFNGLNKRNHISVVSSFSKSSALSCNLDSRNGDCGVSENSTIHNTLTCDTNVRTSYETVASIKPLESNSCAELTSETGVTNSKPMCQLNCKSINAETISSNDQTAICNLDVASESENVGKKLQFIVNKDPTSLNDDARNFEKTFDESLPSNSEKGTNECWPKLCAKGKQKDNIKSTIIPIHTKKPESSFADAFMSFVASEKPRNKFSKENGGKERKKVTIKANLKKNKPKFSKKKIFTSQEVALMRGFYGRCRSISLFNGKFLTRGNVFANQIKRSILGLPKEKQKFIRITSNSCLKQTKRVKGSPRKVLGRPKNKIKLTNLIDEHSSQKLTVGKSNALLVRKSQGNKVKKNNTKRNLSKSREVILGRNNSLKSKNNLFIIEADGNSVLGVDAVKSNFMNIKDSEKLYSQLIEEACVTDFDSSSEKSDSDLQRHINVGIIKQNEVSDAILSEDEKNVLEPKPILHRQLGARRRPSFCPSANLDIDQCCGHWFHKRKSYINHLIEMDADSIHTAKLLDIGMLKCPLCPRWTTINGEKRHLADLHGGRYPNKQDHSTVKIPFKAKIPSGGQSGLNCKTLKRKPTCILSLAEIDKETKMVSGNGIRPCPMSKKLGSQKLATNDSKEIICNLADDPRASDSIIKIASVSELPNHLKPVIQLSLKENVVGKSSSKSSFANNLISESSHNSISLKPLTGHNVNKTIVSNGNEKVVAMETSKLRRPFKNSKNYNSFDTENSLNTSINDTQQLKNKKFPLLAKDENSLDISRGRRFNNENNDSFKRRRRRRSSRLSCDDSPERMTRNGPIGRMKLKNYNSKRNRSFRRNGRKIRRCGFHSSETSDGTSDQSESDSSANHEKEFLDYEVVNDNIENIPTVELDLFTIDSFNEFPCVFLTDPTNPNFKVYANMDAIFVGDSALGDVTNQLGYVTDVNNVVYVNPSHFLFPKIDNEFLNLKLGSSKMGRASQNTRKTIKPVKEEATNVKDLKSNINNKPSKSHDDILAIATESIKEFDKENLTVVDNENICKTKLNKVPKDNSSALLSTNISASDVIGEAFTERLPLAVSSAKLLVKEHPVAKSAFQPTIIVKSEASKRKISLIGASNKIAPPNQDVIVIRTSTNKVIELEDETSVLKQSIKSSDCNGNRNLQKNISSASLNYLKKDACSQNKGIPGEFLRFKEPIISELKSNLKQDVGILDKTVDVTDVSHSLRKIDYKSCMTSSPKQKNYAILPGDSSVKATFGEVHDIKVHDSLTTNLKALDSVPSSDNIKILAGTHQLEDCASLDNASIVDNFSLIEPDSASSMSNIYEKDKLISFEKINLLSSTTKENENYNTKTLYKESDDTRSMKEEEVFPLKTNGMKKSEYAKRSSLNSSYQKDDIISLDDAIAALAPLDGDNIDARFPSTNIDASKMEDLDILAISSQNNSGLTILKPDAVPLVKPKCTDDESTTPILNLATSSNFKENLIEGVPIRSFQNELFPQVEIVGESQVVVASAEISNFETLEDGVCLEDVLEKDAADFDTLSLNDFLINKTDLEAARLPIIQNVDLNTAGINSHPKQDSVTSSPSKNDSSCDLEYTKDDSFSATDSLFNSSFEEIDETSLQPIAYSPLKYSNNFSITDIVKGKSLWDTPLLCSPVRPSLQVPTAPITPARRFSKSKLEHLHDVPLSSIPDLLSPSRDFADRYLESGPVVLSPNTVSSVLSPNSCSKNSNLFSPITDFNGREKQVIKTPTALIRTPFKNSRTNRKSAKKNILYSPKLLTDKDLDFGMEPTNSLNEDSFNLLETKNDDTKCLNDIPTSKLTPDKQTSRFLSNNSLSIKPLLQTVLPDNTSDFKSSAPNTMNSNSSPKKIGIPVCNSPYSESSLEMSSNFLSCDSPSSNSSVKKFTGFKPSDSSPSKVSLESFSGFLSNKEPIKEVDSAKLGSFKKSEEINSVFEGFDASSPRLVESAELLNRTNTSLRMKISLKGYNNSKAEASFNNLPKPFITDDENRGKNPEDESSSSSSSSSSSGSSSSSSSSSGSDHDSFSSSSDESSESSDENIEDLQKIVLTQFDSVSGMRKRTPSKPIRSSHTVSPPSNDAGKVNLNKNTDLTSLKITVREAEIESTRSVPKELSNNAKNVSTISSGKNHKQKLSKSKKVEGAFVSAEMLCKKKVLSTNTSPVASKSNEEFNDDRIWHSRGAKLKAQIMISDHQKGISDTSVGSHLLETVDKPDNGINLTSGINITNTMVHSPLRTDSLKTKNVFRTQRSKTENRDIRTYFSQATSQHKWSSSPVSEELNNFISPNFISPITRKDKSSNLNAKHSSLSKTKKRKRSEDHMDIRAFLSPPELLVRKSSTTDFRVRKKSRLGLMDSTSGENSQRNHSAEVQKKYDKIVENSLKNSDDVLTLYDFNFEGFNPTSLASSLRSRMLSEYVDVLKMTWWFVRDRYPVPVDQLCDWDEDQLNSILFENG